MTGDPYIYPGTNTLINKFDIKDAAKLQDLEALFFRTQLDKELPQGSLDYNHLKSIHLHFFGELYKWAGKERTINMSKSESLFARTDFISKEINKIFSKLKSENYLKNLDQPSFCKNLSYYFNEINAVHPFREGNGRTLRIFSDVLAEQAGYQLDWASVKQPEYLRANILGFNGNYDEMEKIFNQITSSLHQEQSIKTTQIELAPKTHELFKNYVEKQIKLSEFVYEKNSNILKNPERSKEYSEKAKNLSHEIKILAKHLIGDKNIIKHLEKSIIISTQHQGGFKAIHERVKK